MSASIYRNILKGVQSLSGRLIPSQQAFRPHLVDTLKNKAPVNQLARNLSSNASRSNGILNTKPTPGLFSQGVVSGCLSQCRSFSSVLLKASPSGILAPSLQVFTEQRRTKIKYSLTHGRPKTVRAVVLRFKRLNWGIWIRTKCGRHKHQWKKSPARRLRLQQHVFVNKTQTKLLDKMVNRYYKEKKYYPDDPYTRYQVRHGHGPQYYKPPRFLP